MLFEILLVSAVVFSWMALQRADLLQAVIVLAVADLVLAVLFYMMAAPDIAITQAVVSAGLIPLLFMVAINKTTRDERK